jgi:NAD dependent epimerase/dehydratase
MNIFVTGACGFIGSHLVEKLVKNNYNVKALVFYNNRNNYGWLENLDEKILKNVSIVAGDIRDQDLMIKYTKKMNAVIHLAALISIPYSYLSPQNYIDTNIIGTHNILLSAKKNKLSKVIITSTSEVYGTALKVPIDEDHPLNAQSPYAATKIAADQLALSFYKSYNLPVTILRPFNTYGPRQSARAIIPTILSQILNNNSTIKLGNINPIRDFTYVEDTCNAFLSALKNKRIIGETINIGNNFEISIREILNILKEDYNFKFRIKIDKKRIRPKKSEVFRLYASNKKAKKLLGWKPKFQGNNGFNKGLKETIRWLTDKNNLSLYKSELYNL